MYHFAYPLPILILDGGNFPMRKLYQAVLFLSLSGVFISGCAGGYDGNPASPDLDNSSAGTTMGGENRQSTMLWGYYDLHFDFENGTVEAVANRTAEFTANVVDILNGSPAALGFNVNAVDVLENAIFVDIDVILSHPIPLEAYDGYDVRGVFIGDGSAQLAYNPDLKYGNAGDDQVMLNADGYTRWFNPVEFKVPGVLGYTKGIYATPGYNPNATLNPYKLYANGLGPEDSAYDFVSAKAGPGNNVFKAGATNTRKFLLEFPSPNPQNVIYGYAVIASWKGEEPADHPSNAEEPVAITVTITDGVYYVDDSTNGGLLVLDFSLAGYGMSPGSIKIESSVLSQVHSFNPADIMVDQGDTYSRFKAIIEADSVLTVTDNDLWIIAEMDGVSYGNDFGVPNTAEPDPLAAFWHFQLNVADTVINFPPVIESGVDGLGSAKPYETSSFAVTASDLNNDPLTYEWIVSSTAGGEIVFNGPGDGNGGFEVDWTNDIGAQVGDQFDINCNVSDSINPPVPAETLKVSIVPNLPPVLIQDTSGPETVDPGDVSSYTIIASDFDNDPLTYLWEVWDELLSTQILTGPGDGNGEIMVDWTNDIGAVDGEFYHIWCSVGDGYNPSVTSSDLLISIMEQPNLPPEIIQDTDGPKQVDPSDVSLYSIIALDPDFDPLSYLWEVWDDLLVTQVFSGPGDGNGGLTVDWTNDVGAVDGETYRLWCSVNDGINLSVYSSELAVDVIETPNFPPQIISGIDGDATPESTDISIYTVSATDPESDPLTYDWSVTDLASTLVVLSGPGDGNGAFVVDWTNDIGASNGEEYRLDASVADPFNPEVFASPLSVVITDPVPTTLYLYDGEVDDGGIVPYDDASGNAIISWEYCPAKTAWDEDTCGPYGVGEYRLARTPLITFPDPGTFSKIHLEIWHWGDMQNDGACYGTLGTAREVSPGEFGYEPNYLTHLLSYIEGFDFNDGSFDDWTDVYGSEGAPEWSHFDASVYAGQTLAIAFGFGEFGVGNPSGQDGWNIRKLHIWYE
jgi:hypothetical protein